MKKYISIIIFLFALQFVAYSQNVSKKSYLYSIKDSDTLYLDKYTYAKPKKDSVILKKPAVIFMFGGGFYTGQRDNQSYIPFFEYLAANGYEVFSIDYRLGLKKFQNDDKFMNHISGKKSKKLKGVEFVKVFDKPLKWQWKIYSQQLHI
jgi:Carboxylesterase type B